MKKNWASAPYTLLDSDLFSLPEIQFTLAPAILPKDTAASFSLGIVDGRNNPVSAANIDWWVEAVDPVDTLPAIHPHADGRSATVSASELATYRLWASAYGDSFLGPLGKRYVSTTFQVDDQDVFIHIPAGTNAGINPPSEQFAYSGNYPINYSLTPGAFYIAQHELTLARWKKVRDWAVEHGYQDLPVGWGKGSAYPVNSVDWYQAVKWCNARSEMEGRTPCYRWKGAVYRTNQPDPQLGDPEVVCDFAGTGYRLPTSVEWEYAARGGRSSSRFPWGDTISHESWIEFKSFYRVNQAMRIILPPMFNGLYIHVPFCASKCAYCAFYSETGTEAEDRQAWLEKIVCELRKHADCLKTTRTVFIGGGTPTILQECELESLLTAISETLPLSRLQEFTIECNPETMTPAKARILAEGGVNRVSLGVQSFNQSLRDALGRGGSAKSAATAVNDLGAAGIENLGADLIYGIPGQTLPDWEMDVRQACSLGVCHLSAYALTLEEGTALASRGISPPGDADIADMWKAAADCAAEFDLTRYEVSNYARPGRECRHNDQIWHGATYLGLGPAAASFDGASRWTQTASLDKWLRNEPPEEDRLSEKERACELLAFGMRTANGWNLEEFYSLTGYTIQQLRGDAVTDLREQGLVEWTDDSLRPTEKGLLFADTVALELL